MFEDVQDARTPDATQDLYGSLKRRLLSGDLRPGAMMIPKSLSAEYGLSRTPVREALQRLEHDGLVQKATRGFTVRSRSPEEVLEVCEARIVLEGSLAREAALKRSPLDLARMRQVHDLVEKLVKTPSRIDEDHATHLVHIDWHYAVRNAGHNRTASDLLDLLDAQLFLSDWDTQDEERPSPIEDLEVTLAEHGRVLEAIEASDPDQAKTLMEDHLKRGRDSRLKRLASP